MALAETISRLWNKGLALVESRKELRFLISGGISEAFDYASFLLLMHYTNRLYLSNSVSFMIGVLCGYFFHKFWSFRGDQKYTAGQQFVSYGVVGGINFVMINAIVGGLTDGLGVPHEISKLIGIAAGAVLSYVLSNYIIFRHKKADANADTQSSPAQSEASSAE